MAKMTQNLQRKFKITDFLLGSGFRTWRLFCRYCYVTWVYQLLYLYVKRSSRCTPLKVYRWRYRAILPHPLLKPISDVNFRHFWGVCKFLTFRACLGPQNAINSEKNNNIIINEADSWSSHHRCSGPNNKQSRFKRVLTPSVLGP